MGLFSSPEQDAAKKEKQDAAKKEKQDKVQKIRKKYNLDMDRFRTIYDYSGKKIFLDIITGICYIYFFDKTFNGGVSITGTMTLLVGSDGKPIVYSKEEIEEIISILE